MEVFAVLIAHPLLFLSYIALIASFVSMWIYHRIWVWGTLFVLSFALAYLGHGVTYMAIAPILMLFLCELFLTKEIVGFWRLFLVMIAAIISFGFIYHFVRGFEPLRLLTGWKANPNGLPINWALTYDKPLIGLFILGLYLPLLREKKEWLQMLLKTIPWAALTILTVMGVATSAELLLYQPHYPSNAFLWMIFNLFLVVIPEEAFFRGFIQEEITYNLENRASFVLAILLSSLLYTLAHAYAAPHIIYLLFIFLSSLFYGTIYTITRSVESSIITHFLLNLAHFFLFTYPLRN